MAQIPGGYTADENDQWQGFEALPAGEYKVQIIDSDLCDTRAGDGQYIKLVYEVVGDPLYDGRKIFDNINIANPSPDAVRIGKQRLNTICAVTGVPSLKDTAQLHGKTMSLLIAVGKNKQTGEDTNIIKKYFPLNNVGVAASSRAPQESGAKKKNFIK
jgi:hypothetical protein